MKGVAIMNNDHANMSPFMVAMVGIFLPDIPEVTTDDIDWEGLL